MAIDVSFRAGSSAYITVSFVDEYGSTFVPNDISWTLYRDGAVVNEQDAVTVSTDEVYSEDGVNKVDIGLYGNDLVRGTLYIVVQGTYNSTHKNNAPYRNWAELRVKEVPGLE